MNCRWIPDVSDRGSLSSGASGWTPATATFPIISWILGFLARPPPPSVLLQVGFMEHLASTSYCVNTVFPHLILLLKGLLHYHKCTVANEGQTHCNGAICLN